MKEKQAIPFQVAPQMIEMDVQRNVHQMGGHMQSEKHLKNMHQLSYLMHSVLVGGPAAAAPPPYAKPPPHGAHPPYSAPPPYAAEPSHVASPQPLFHFLVPHVLHPLNNPPRVPSPQLPPVAAPPTLPNLPSADSANTNLHPLQENHIFTGPGGK